MERVRCVTPGDHYGKTALRRSDGLVQMDGSAGLWRAGEQAKTVCPQAFGWHSMPHLKWEKTNDQL